MKFQNINFIKIISYLYAIFVSIALLIPLDSYIITGIIKREEQPSNITSYFIHLIIFFIFYLLFYLSYKSLLNNFVVVVIYSVFLEVLQIFTSRGFQINDIIFNISGILFSFLFISYFLHKKD